MRDNQPKHRQQAKERRKLERRKASLAGRPTALIVCEGRCTEPYYLAGLREAMGVNPANVVIAEGTATTDPQGLVRRARQRFEKTPDFDWVFVVLDADTPGLGAARAAAARPLRKADGSQVVIEFIVSNPSFEFWLLLHFEYTTRAFGSGAEVTPALAAHLPEYAKGDREIFARVQRGLDRAVENAERVGRDVAGAGATGPGTDMPILVEALRAMRPSGHTEA